MLRCTSYNTMKFLFFQLLCGKKYVVGNDERNAAVSTMY